MQETFYTVPGCPLRIALVTDLHERPWDSVLDSLRRNRPGLICFPGDFLYGRPAKSGLTMQESGVLPLFRACAELAPCFVSLGNHEWMTTAADFDLLREKGAQLLDDQYATLDVAGTRLVIGGLTSARVTEYRRLRKAGCSVKEADRRAIAIGLTPPRFGWLDAYCAEEGCHILLCHHPEYYPRYLRHRGIELILSGHAHGGQIRIRDRGLFAPGQGLLPKLTSGVFEGRLVVSRGLANCQIVPRLFNPPELVYMDP